MLSTGLARLKEWSGVAALMLVVAGGTAYAADTIDSSDIIDESILSIDVKNDEIRTGDVRDDALAGGGLRADDLAAKSVRTGEILNNQIRSADVRDDVLAGGGLQRPDIATGAVGSSEIANGVITSEEVEQLNEFFEARVDDGGCTGDVHVVTTCVEVPTFLERSGALLINAAGNWSTTALDDTAGDGSGTDVADAVRGTCQFTVDGAQVGTQLTVGERSTTVSNHPSNNPGTIALTALTDDLGSGSHTVRFVCIEVDGDLDWSSVTMTVALVPADVSG